MQAVQKGVSSDSAKEKNNSPVGDRLQLVLDGIAAMQPRVDEVLSLQDPAPGRKVATLPEVFRTLLPVLVLCEIQIREDAGNGKPVRLAHQHHQIRPQTVRYWLKQPLWTAALRPLFVPLISRLGETTSDEVIRPDVTSGPVERLEPGPAGQARIRHLLRDVLGDALRRPDMPQVVKIPPGLGKTSGMMRAICRLSRQSAPLRVLWFVRESRTLDESGKEKLSLGRDALREFRELGARVRVIQSGQGGGRAWPRKSSVRPGPHRPEVRILAHAYLPILLGPALPRAKPVWMRQLLEGTDLIVIDEDPSQAFTLTDDAFPKRLLWRRLHGAMTACRLLGPGPLETPVRPGRSEAGEASGRLGVTQNPEQHARWLRQWARAIEPDASAASWTSLQSRVAVDLGKKRAPGRGTPETKVRRQERLRLNRACDAGARLFVDGLAAELTRLRLDPAAVPRLHFGLRWEAEPDWTAVRPPVFLPEPGLRFSLRRPVAFQVAGQPVPTVILDAYADHARYESLLGASVGLRAASAPLRLQVEQLPLPARRVVKAVQPHRAVTRRAGDLNIQTLKAASARRHLIRAMMDAVHLLLDQGGCRRPVLFLGPQLLTNARHAQFRAEQQAVHTFQFAARWLHYLTPVSASTQTSERFQGAYWWAGRGRNAFQGHDVVALTRPTLPERHLGTLMALKPEMHQEEERKAMRRQDEDAEFLQMLHRGRQLRDRMTRPLESVASRVLLMYEMDADQCERLEAEVEMVTSPDRGDGHGRLAGLPLVPGKLELTRLVATAVAWELLSRPNDPWPLPGGWLPLALFQRLNLATSSPETDERKDRLLRRFVQDLRLTTATPHERPELRMTAAALQGAGLWEVMPNRSNAPEPRRVWAPPGNAESLYRRVRALLETSGLVPGLEAAHVPGLGEVWIKGDTTVGEIRTWASQTS